MTLLPTGAVTFLFTDIEGSMKLWETYPEAMQSALARHDDILRSAIEAHGGHIFKTIGDAFCAAFSTAPAAVAAAAQAQSTLAAEDWSAVGALRVRMALTSGVSHERDGDYFGPPLNRVARLLPAAHGGQILLGQVAQELARDFLPTDMELRDLGEHRLKDLAQPEHIYQLVIAGLPPDFPPLRSLNSRPNNLPAQLTSLVGRENEVQAVRSLLRHPDVRLVTLTGSGGTGKTRLGLHVAAGLLDDFEDGVFLVALALTTDPALVPSAIAEALDLKEVSSQPPLKTLKSDLREKSLLLVLDNFEQVTAAARLVAELLEACAQLKVVVSSRIALKVRGEHEFPVPPLALPGRRPPPPIETLTQYASVALFIERAKSVKPDFAVSVENAPAIAEICYRLDGLPLAIELAAARIKLLSPGAMLTRLTGASRESLLLLTGGPRDLPARQRTLEAVIAWSYNLLNESEQALFRRLAVFAGGCTLAAIDEVVCGTIEGDFLNPCPVDVLNEVSSLLDNSLLWQQQRTDEPRFFMLETIRAYAEERLVKSDEAFIFRRQHARFFMALAEAAYPKLLGSREQAAWIEQLEREHDNLRTALAWLVEHESKTGLRLAVALARFWRTIGHDAELRMALGAALERGGEAPAEVRIVALREMGEVLLRSGGRGNYERARKLLEESVQLSRDTGDFKNLAWTLRKLGEAVHYTAGNAEEAHAFYKESLTIEWDRGDKNGAAATYSYLGNLARDEGDLTDATALYEESAALFDAAHNTSGLARALTHLAAVAYMNNDWVLAHSHYEKCRMMLRDLKDKAALAWTLRWLGELALRHGDYEGAQSLHAEHLEISREMDDKEGMVRALWGLAEAARHEGHAAQERALLEQVAPLVRDLHDKTRLCRVLGYRARLAAHARQWAWVARLLGTVEGICEGDDLVTSGQRRVERTRITAEARAALGEETFRASLAAGKAMTIEQAASHCLGEDV